jgi:ATP-dependent RNA helicase RhlE
MSSYQLGLVSEHPSSPAQAGSSPAQLAAPRAPLAFDQLGLTPELLRAVAGQEYAEPTPVQSQSIPIVLAGRDLLASAQTGTGKTAAFVLPILQLLNASRPAPRQQSPGQRRPRGATGLPIRCLVLTPTRELALQIEECVRTYGAERPVRSTTIYGGVGFQPQVNALRGGPEIVVATPGRLLDHAGQGTIDLGSVEILVLDEADRMLDMGFIRDIRRILALLPAQRQNLLFSATFSDDIRELAGGLLHQPAEVQIARRNAPIELVRQVVYPVDRERKRELLSHLIRGGRIDRALVFTRTKHGANRLAEQLEMDGIAAAAIHGNKSQGQRVRALDDFKAGRVAILVATEVASRGLDIEGLPHVVNFELPMVAQDYVHRIGRTGRAGMEGDAVSLVCIDETTLLDEIQALLRQPIRREIVPGFEVNRSIPREPIRQRSGDVRPMSGRRQAAPRQAAPRQAAPRQAAPRQAAPSDSAAARRPAPSGPRQVVAPGGFRRPIPSEFRRPAPGGLRQVAQSDPRQTSTAFNVSAPVEPRRAAQGGFRRPVPSDFSQAAPIGYAPRGSAPRGAAARGAAPRRPQGFTQPPARHSSPAPAGRPFDRAPAGRPANADYRPSDRSAPYSLPGERIARSGGRTA